VSNKPIFENLLSIDSAGAHIELRCPLTPERNTREDYYRGIAALANRLTNVVSITLLPYHPLGIAKCKNFGYDSPIHEASLWINPMPKMRRDLYKP